MNNLRTTSWFNFIYIMISKKSQTQKHTCYMILFIGSSRTNRKIMALEVMTVFTLGEME